jgi:hypothetical protein
MRISRHTNTVPPTLREHRERRARALDIAKALHPDKDVQIHGYYAGGFFAEVRNPGENHSEVVAVPE